MWTKWLQRHVVWLLTKFLKGRPQNAASRKNLTLNYKHQRKISKQLLDFANEGFEGTLHAETEFTRKDYAFLGLADKARITFEAIQVLCEKSLLDDAFALSRTMIEAVINGAYVAHMGDQVANDYADFPDYWDWVEYSQLIEVEPEMAAGMPPEKIAEMKRKHDAVKHRYEKLKGEWCTDNFFRRASKIDAAAGPDFKLMRVLVNLPWRKASVYVHGTANSIASRLQETESGVVIQRRYTEQEAAGVLFIANMTMFALLAFLDIQLGKRHVNKWRELHAQWGGGPDAIE